MFVYLKGDIPVNTLTNDPSQGGSRDCSEIIIKRVNTSW